MVDVGVLIEVRLCIRVLVLEPGLEPFLYVVKACDPAGPYLVAALLQCTCDRLCQVVNILAFPIGDCCRGSYLSREEMLKGKGYPRVDVGGVGTKVSSARARSASRVRLVLESKSSTSWPAMIQLRGLLSLPATFVSNSFQP